MSRTTTTDAPLDVPTVPLKATVATLDPARDGTGADHAHERDESRLPLDVAGGDEVAVDDPTVLVAVHDRLEEALPEAVVSPTHQLRGIDLRSLTSFALLFYGAVAGALALGIATVWVGASLVGVVAQFEEFMQSIGFRGFRVIGPELIFGGLLLALALVLFLTVITVLAAGFYNVMASHGRGVKVRIGALAPPVGDAEQVKQP